MTFVRKTLSNAAGSRSSSDPSPPIPALSTSASSPPNRATVSATARSASTATPASATTASPPISAATASIGSGLPPCHSNRVPVRGEPPGNRRTDARATAGDEGDAAHARRSLTISWSSTV